MKPNIKLGRRQFNFPFLGPSNEYESCKVTIDAGNLGFNQAATKTSIAVTLFQDIVKNVLLKDYYENVATTIQQWINYHLENKLKPEEFLWLIIEKKEDNLVIRNVIMNWNDVTNQYELPVFQEINPHFIMDEAMFLLANSLERMPPIFESIKMPLGKVNITTD